MKSPSDVQIEVREASQFCYLPFTPLPAAFAGKTVRLEIVTDVAADSATQQQSFCLSN